MVVEQLLADEVWGRLDPRAGRLSPRGRRGVMAVVVAAALVVGLAVLAAVTGTVVPRVSAYPDYVRSEPTSHTITVRVRVHNAAPTALHVHDLTTDESLYEITATPAPFTVAGHTSRSVSVTIRVRSCATVTPDEVVPVGIDVEHWWGNREQALFSAADTTLSVIAADACGTGRT